MYSKTFLKSTKILLFRFEERKNSDNFEIFWASNTLKKRKINFEIDQ